MFLLMCSYELGISNCLARPNILLIDPFTVAQNFLGNQIKRKRGKAKRELKLNFVYLQIGGLSLF